MSEGKDLEANAGVSAAQGCSRRGRAGVDGSKAALEKDKAMYRLRAHHRSLRRRGDRNGRLHRRSASRWNLSNKGDSALCRLSQNDLLRLVIPVPERAVPDVMTEKASLSRSPD